MSKFKPFAPYIVGLILLVGLFLRLYRISANQFLFYDEAMYIGYNREFLNLVANNPPHSLSELGIILALIFRLALQMPKALWFFLLSLRVFFLGPEAWYFARWISAASGIATTVLLYFWARRCFTPRIALLSALVLWILPSHVFYSRSGMQESFSTLLFFAGIYLYMLNERMRVAFFVSAFLLACVYLTNYRMIIAPVFVVFIEAFEALTLKRAFNWLKMVVYGLVFAAVVLGVGSLYGWANLYVSFAWMFHQAQDAGGKFNPINFLSYPYDVFALEGFFFACFFWANIIFIKRQEYAKLLPFGLAVLQMVIFSFAAEKGARYLCVVLPFMATAAAVVIDDLWQKQPKIRGWTIAFSGLAVASMVYLSTSLSVATTDYENAMDLITSHDPQAGIVSTQPLDEGLFLADAKKIYPCPHDLYTLVNLYKQGARYLVLDPQAYISWTADGRRFSPPLQDFLQTTLDDVKPLVTLPHLNRILLTRFVLDHNEQIVDSLKFLAAPPSQGYGRIRVYDLGEVFAIIKSHGL